MKRQHPIRRRAGPNGMTRIVSKIIDRLASETGALPSDEAVARVLAISVTRVQHHRRLLAGGGK